MEDRDDIQEISETQDHVIYDDVKASMTSIPQAPLMRDVSA